MLDIEAIKNFSIDKSGWKKVKFGDAVFEPKESVKDPVAEGIVHVVGLEHIDSEDMQLRRSASIEESTTFTKKFNKDDVLFGRRRAYLKKAAKAEFEGICSGDITVMRAKEELLLPDLLPFIVHNEKFFDHAIKHSAGGLSPRVKFKDLANYEFLLPPKEMQIQLLHIFKAIDYCQETNLNLLSKLETILEVKSSELIWKTKHEQSALILYTKDSIGKLVDGDWVESKDQSESGIKLLQLADVGVRTFINKSDRYISSDTFKNLKCFEVLPGDVLIARMPEPIGRACIVKSIDKQMITVVDCCVARVDNKSDSKFLVYLLNSREFLHKANALASGTTRQRISRKNLEKIKVSKPNLNVQQEIAASLDSIFEAILSIKVKLRNEKALIQSLINKVF